MWIPEKNVTHKKNHCFVFMLNVVFTSALGKRSVIYWSIARRLRRMLQKFRASVCLREKMACFQLFLPVFLFRIWVVRMLKSAHILNLASNCTVVCALFLAKETLSTAVNSYKLIKSMASTVKIFNISCLNVVEMFLRQICNDSTFSSELKANKREEHQ